MRRHTARPVCQIQHVRPNQKLYVIIRHHPAQLGITRHGVNGGYTLSNELSDLSYPHNNGTGLLLLQGTIQELISFSAFQQASVCQHRTKQRNPFHTNQIVAHIIDIPSLLFT